MRKLRPVRQVLTSPVKACKGRPPLPRVGQGDAPSAMAKTTITDVKRALIEAGLEVYRTRGEEVQIADRVRENLIMDSGVSLAAGSSLRVGFIVRAQRSDFPSDPIADLFARARALASDAAARGFVESETRVSDLNDPGDPSRTLDTWYEVRFEKAVADLPQALDEARFALSIEKAASSNGRD